jgi:hypothetical protein
VGARGSGATDAAVRLQRLVMPLPIASVRSTPLLEAAELLVGTRYMSGIVYSISLDHLE